MTQNQKEISQYSTAIGGVLSGIIMCFISFFCNNYDIAGSVLGYLGEWLIFCAGVFGISIYVRTQVLEAKTQIEKELRQEIENNNNNLSSEKGEEMKTEENE